MHAPDDDTLDALLREALPKRADARLLQRCRAWRAAGPLRAILGRDHADYPALLRHTSDAPKLLFVDGDTTRLWHPAIAIVGTRAPTAGGRDIALAFAGELARRGWCIVSGMAAGIDTAAHHAALAEPEGRTIAVLGSGIDIAYPRGNRALMQAIAERGAVVSEYPPGTRGQAFQFPRRNRIVAGLSLGTLVVEAAQRSGALITARLAADAGREVFAIPSSIRNPQARGCHRLIRDGAQLVETVDEIEAAIAPLAAACAGDLRERLRVPTSSSAAVHHDSRDMEAQAQRLWRALGHDPTPMEALVDRTGLTAAEVASILLVMELEGRVVSEHGRYTRKSS